MILNLGVIGKLGGALLEKGQRPLVDTTLVEDPSQSVRDARILWEQLLTLPAPLSREGVAEEDIHEAPGSLAIPELGKLPGAPLPSAARRQCA